MKFRCLLVLGTMILCGAGCGAQSNAVTAPVAAQSNAVAVTAATNTNATVATLATVEKMYPIGTNGTLVLRVPTNWLDTFRHVQEDTAREYDEVFFMPTNEAFFNLTVDAVSKQEYSSTNKDEMKARLLYAGLKELPGAVEKNIQLREFQGVQSAGAYFRITDKRYATLSPPESEGRYLTQGYAVVSNLALTFHFVWNAPETQEARAIEVMKNARYIQVPAGLGHK